MNQYAVLGLPWEATQEQIREAYFVAARHFHPDVNPDPALQEEFLKVQRAYETLSDIPSRKEHDHKLTPEEKQAPISIDIQFSRTALRRMDEPQLIYGLMTLTGLVDPRPEEIPPRHLCLVVDRSTSMQGNRIEVVKANILKLIKELNPQDKISVVTFSDRANLVIPGSKIANLRSIESRIRSIDTGGGTEILQGLQMGVDELRYANSKGIATHLILLTDGHTYGDEEACLRLARESSRENIILSALGIGGEWNDAFLDHLTALSGGSARYVSSTDDLTKHMTQQVNTQRQVFARGMRFDFNQDSAVKLHYAFRLHPEINPLLVDSTSLHLGNLVARSSLSILMEFLVEETTESEDFIRLGSGFVEYETYAENGAGRLFVNMKRPVVEEMQAEFPPPAILNAMSRLTLYRMQERVMDEVKAGDVPSATRHLKKLATNLLSQGKSSLAHVVLKEVRNLEATQHFSDGGDKRIKYGTRSLLLPPN